MQNDKTNVIVMYILNYTISGKYERKKTVKKTEGYIQQQKTHENMIG